MMENRFNDIVGLIRQSREKAIRVVNSELIDLYWNIGKYIAGKVETAEWGQGIVRELAVHIKQTEPALKGFSHSNLWRMKQFYEMYTNHPKLSALLREISWSNNMIIMGGTGSNEEREFYIRMSIRERYSTRELERQIGSSLFERTMLGGAKLSALPREMENNIASAFRDSYIFEFLNLSEPYSEMDLQQNLIKKMKDFIVELGKDFLFVGEQYRVQVGMSDFFIDLLFFHRGLQCLVAFELKADRFRPEHLGQLNFYLEALDRDVKRPNENPSIGILLCKNRDHEVVEYAMSRSLSPTMVAEYRMQLPDKKVLQRKLHELLDGTEGD
ncbi:PDDEXK nuclease domain-containing protein [Fluviicola sp.]|uniref:PDDEXK nuclease domain-containing protein n=1 Tax=Fluviicola sp. TaxID=1917219 RepID=UPI0031D7CDC7